MITWIQNWYQKLIVLKVVVTIGQTWVCYLGVATDIYDFKGLNCNFSNVMKPKIFDF